MGRNNIRVSTEKIEAARSQIKQEQERYRGAYEAIYKIDEEINTIWEGVDSSQFSDQLKSFKDDFDDLDHNFTEYLKFLKNAQDEYEKAQEQITKNAEKLAVDR